MKKTNLLLGLAPWVLFSVIAEHIGAGSVGIAAAVAGLASLVLAVRGDGDQLNVIETAGVVTFTGMAAAGFLGCHQLQQNLVDFGRGGCAAILALVMLISAFTVPFTEQYARAQVDPRYWGSPVFRATNKRISLVWSGLIALMATSHLVAGAIDANSGHRPILNIALNWAVPVLIILRGLKMTEEIASKNDVAA